MCGRTVEWRKKWERDWQHVRYCSDGCRRRKLTTTDRQLEETLVGLCERSTSVCPSEAARAVGGEDWRPLMEPARMAARRLVAAGTHVITQRGRVVDPSTAKGPIRVARNG